MTIQISNNNPRISYTATGGQTAFPTNFAFFNEGDINVYINDVLKTLNTNYTVSGGSGAAGTVTLTTGATAGDIIVLTRDVELERTTDFPTSGPFQVASLNVELDKLIAMMADMKDFAGRGLRLSDSDTSAALVVADKDTRKGTVLAFNETTGAIEVGPTIADTNSIAQIKADIATLADIQDGTVATNAITNLSAISSDVTTAASNITEIQSASANATTATTKASEASASATAAATSETNAGASETNAASSATSASNAQTAAESARDSALAAYDNFDDRYLGVKSLNPTVDNDGDALVAGALYFNSTFQKFLVYTGSAWADAYADGTTLVSKSGDIMTGDLSFVQNNKIKMGPTDSYGNTHTINNDSNDNFEITTSHQKDILLKANQHVYLYDTGSISMSTTAVGIAVNGTIQGVGLSLTGNSHVRGYARFEGNIDFFEDTGTTAKLTWDASAERLGLGTTTPSVALEVNSASFQMMKLRRGTSGTSAGIITFEQGNGNAVGHIGGAGDNGGLQFRTGLGTGTERMRIDSAGNLMVGKTSATVANDGFTASSAGYVTITDSSFQPLILNRKTSDGTILELRKNNTTVGHISTVSSGMYLGTSNNSIRFTSSDIRPVNASGVNTTNTVDLGDAAARFKDLYLGGVAYISDGTSSGTQTVVGGNYYIANSGAYPIVFQTNSAERLRIDSNGRVGIGTSSPAVALDVNGDIYARSGIVAADEFRSYTSSLSTYGSNTSALHYFKGKVGIGTSSPSSLIHGSGLNAELRLQHTGNSYYQRIFTDSSNNLKFGTGANGTERMRIDSSGNVGIGTSSPVSIGGHTGVLTLYGSNATGLVLKDAVGQKDIRLDNGDLKITDSGGSPHLAVTSAGRVGLGTSSPQTLLDISHQRSGTRPTLGAGTRLVIESTANNTAFTAATILGGNASGASILNLGDVNDEDVGQVSYHHSDNSMRFRTNAGERLRITSAGLVGIGTSSVYEKLTIGGADETSLTNQIAIRASDNDDIFRIRTNNSTEQVSIEASGDSGNGFMTFGTGSGSAERLRIDSSGIIKLITANDTAGTSKRLIFGTNSFNRAEIRVTNAATYDGSLEFYTGNASNYAERMRLDASGNLLVGQSSTAVPGLSNTTTGLSLTNNGYIFASKADDNVAWFNRNTSDGSIISLRKDGTAVGSIGVEGGDNFYITDNNNTGLNMKSGLIIPCNTNGSTRDNAIDLGASGGRFNDLYLGGGVYIGGTDAANKLDDYEEGTFTPTVLGTSSTGTYTYALRQGIYTKVGNSVSVTLSIYVSATGTASTGQIRIDGLPFATSTAAAFHSFSLGWSQYIPVTNDFLAVYNGGGSTRLQIRNVSDASGADVNASQIGSSGTGAFYIFISGTYTAA